MCTAFVPHQCAFSWNRVSNGVGGLCEHQLAARQVDLIAANMAPTKSGRESLEGDRRSLQVECVMLALHLCLFETEITSFRRLGVSFMSLVRTYFIYTVL